MITVASLTYQRLLYGTSNITSLSATAVASAAFAAADASLVHATKTHLNFGIHSKRSALQESPTKLKWTSTLMTWRLLLLPKRLVTRGTLRKALRKALGMRLVMVAVMRTWDES